MGLLRWDRSPPNEVWGRRDSWGQVVDLGRSPLGLGALACPVPAPSRSLQAKILWFGGAGSYPTLGNPSDDKGFFADTF